MVISEYRINPLRKFYGGRLLNIAITSPLYYMRVKSFLCSNCILLGILLCICVLRLFLGKRFMLIVQQKYEAVGPDSS